MDNSLCIDCYQAPKSRKGGDLCAVCGHLFRRRRTYHETTKRNPELLELHRQRSREGMKALRDRRALERRMRDAAAVMTDPALAGRVRRMIDGKGVARG